MCNQCRSTEKRLSPYLIVFEFIRDEVSFRLNGLFRSKVVHCILMEKDYMVLVWCSVLFCT